MESGMPESGVTFINARHVSSYYAMTIPRQGNIQKMAGAFSAHLGPRFAPPMVMPVPEQIDSIVPRLAFSSIHGFSTVIVSPSTIGLAITYSPDWQVAPELCLAHLIDSAKTVAGLVELLDEPYVLYRGLQAVYELNTNAGDDDLIHFLRQKIGLKKPDKTYHDISVRTTEVLENTFFSNMSVENFRTWPQGSIQPSAFTTPLSDKLVQVRGIRLTADCNDRFAFNEKRGHRSALEATEHHIRLAFDLAETTLETLKD